MLAALLFVFGATVADATPETITVGCSMKRCTDVPANEWDQPSWRFAKYCDEKNLPPDYESVMFDALFAVEDDARSRSMLIGILEKSSDFTLLGCAVAGLARQHDESALSAIAEALKRSAESHDLAFALAFYGSAAADEIALKYIPENERDEYRQSQVAILHQSPS